MNRKDERLLDVCKGFIHKQKVTSADGKSDTKWSEQSQ